MSSAPAPNFNVPCPYCGAEPGEMCNADDGKGPLLVGGGGYLHAGWHKERSELHATNKILVEIAESQGQVQRRTTWRCLPPGCLKMREVLTRGSLLSYVEAFANTPQVCECGAAMVKST